MLTPVSPRRRLLLFLVFLLVCALTVVTSAASQKIMVVHNHHEDQQEHVVEMTRGIEEALAGVDRLFRFFPMDTKRNRKHLGIQIPYNVIKRADVVVL